MVRYVIVVAEDRPDLCDYLKWAFSDDERFQVVPDRRSGRSREVDTERRLTPRQRRVQAELRSKGLVIIREQQGVRVVLLSWRAQGDETEARSGGQRRTDMDERAIRETPQMAGVEPSQRVARWIEDSQYLHDLLPRLLDEHERLKGRAEATERECERLRQEVSELRSENDFFRAERAEIAEAVNKLINVQLMSEILQKLGATPRKP